MRYFGEQLEHFIQERFHRIGKFCATYPKLVLITGIAFCSIMCLGYTNFRIEKDPIKLWSAASSSARVNKAYFDAHFGPFYRITQLIIEPKSNVRPLNFTDTARTVQRTVAVTGSNGTNRSTISVPLVYNVSVLRADVLYEVFKLYEKINHLVAHVETDSDLSQAVAANADSSSSSVKAKKVDKFSSGNTVSLEDICYQPMYPDNRHCAVQSLFQYWQNDPATFLSSIGMSEDGDATSSKSSSKHGEEHQQHETERDSGGFDGHLTHLDECMRNPYMVECVSSFGAPIQPFMVTI
jgi:hypothetical protein